GDALLIPACGLPRLTDRMETQGGKPGHPCPGSTRRKAPYAAPTDFAGGTSISPSELHPQVHEVAPAEHVVVRRERRAGAVQHPLAAAVDGRDVLHLPCSDALRLAIEQIVDAAGQQQPIWSASSYYPGSAGRARRSTQGTPSRSRPTPSGGRR